MPAAFGVRLTSTRALLSVTRGRRFLIAMLSLVAIGAAMPLTARAAAPAPANGTELNTTSSTANLSRAAPGDFARRVKIRGGRKVYLECRGRGRPTVVLEAGTGNNARVWHAHEPGRRAILPAVARFTRVCAYDRPGTVWDGTLGQPRSVSRSDPVAMPRTARDIVLDLHALLRKGRTLPEAHLRGPYVLAGHSFGGMIARLYATTYPKRVAGLVSIDAQSEWFTAAYRRLLTPQQYADAFLHPMPFPGFPGYSDYEQLALEASGAEVRQAQADTPLRRMPLVVLSHSLTDPNPFGFPTDWPIAALNQAFQASQDKLAELVPGARHVIASRSQHYIQLDQPGLVISAIRSVVKKARRR